jgi:hypothetical protein
MDHSPWSSLLSWITSTLLPWITSIVPPWITSTVPRALYIVRPCILQELCFEHSEMQILQKSSLSGSEEATITQVLVEVRVGCMHILSWLDHGWVGAQGPSMEQAKQWSMLCLVLFLFDVGRLKRFNVRWPWFLQEIVVTAYCILLK